MLKIAFALPSRSVLSSIVRPSTTQLRRYNNNGPSVSPPGSDIPSMSKDASLRDFIHPSSKPIDSLSKEEEDLADEELEKELVGITEADLTASVQTAPEVAETEAELFGRATTQEIKQNGTTSAFNPKLIDPKRLPLREPLGKNSTEAEYAATLVHGRSIHIPFFHPRTHDIPVANIQFRSHHPDLLDLFTHFATHAASSLGIPISRVVTLPTKRTLWTVLRSPHVHKKSQENFERRVHKRAIKAWDADPEVIDRWCRYLRRHALGGVGMRITRWERMPLGIGKSTLEKEKLTVGEKEKEKIRTLGRKIVVEELNVLGKNNEDAKTVPNND